MLRSDEKQPATGDIAQQSEQLLYLKESLTGAINSYIQNCDIKPNKMSFYSMTGPRLHYKNGDEGRERAAAYLNKIDSCQSVYELIETIHRDLYHASEQSKKSITDKTTQFLSDRFDFLKSQVTQFVNSYYPSSNTSNEATSPHANVVDLGNSEVLAGDLAKVICDTLKLKDYNHDLYQELERTDVELARRYIANELNRRIGAIGDWLDAQRRFTPSIN